MWSNRWPASQIWPAASSLAEMENNCSNSRCCLNTHTSVSPCYALMVWLCPAGAPLIALTTLLLCPAPTGTVPGSVSREFIYGVERGACECQAALPVSAVNLPGCLCWAKRAGLYELEFPLSPSATPRTWHPEKVQPKRKVKAYCTIFIFFN